ncbi:D-alanyl-D-alanine carboxypeptidase/D-alanyl-D-alanine-endopeptidase [Spirillospora sp. NPDC050679]
MPQPPTVAERDLVRTAATVPAADPGAARAPDPSALARRLAGPAGGAGAKINAVVIDAVTRRPLFQQRADQPATPASTTKLATSVAALAALGPGHRIATRVVRGPGGGVVLVGGGDPTLTALPARPEGGHPPYASLADLARQTAAALRAAGVRRTRVDYDASAYEGPRTAAGWKPNYVPDGEAAPVSALAVDEGRVAPLDTERKTRVADPPAAAAAQFARALTRAGVPAKAGRRVQAADGSAQVAEVRSPPLSALVEHLMTASDNDVAEAVARQVAVKQGLPPSFAGAAQAVTGVLRGLGVADGVLVNDGSGLSTRNRITPLALARIAALAASPERPGLRAAITGLPVAGFSGTLRPPRYAVPSSQAAAGMVRAKTGTLAGVSTLAGVVRDTDGRLLAFAFMMGDGKGTADPAKLDQLAALVATCGC